MASPTTIQPLSQLIHTHATNSQAYTNASNMIRSKRISLLNHTDIFWTVLCAFTCERNASTEGAQKKKLCFPSIFLQHNFFVVFFSLRRALSLFRSYALHVCARLCLYARLSKAIQRQYKKCCKANEHGKNAIPLEMRKNQQRPFVLTETQTHMHTSTRSKIQKNERWKRIHIHTESVLSTLDGTEKLLQRKNTCVFIFDRRKIRRRRIRRWWWNKNR